MQSDPAENVDTKPGFKAIQSWELDFMLHDELKGFEELIGTPRKLYECRLKHIIVLLSAI